MSVRQLCSFLIAGFMVSIGGASVHAGSIDIPPVAPANFTAPQSNPYFPLDAGTTFLYEADTEDGVELNQVAVTPAMVTILGVSCTVVHDVEWIDVEGVGMILIEETDDWFAADNFGNVWYFGEATIEHLYDDEWNPIGTSTEGSWTAGVDGAEPGIVMLANPMVGIAYSQEYAEDIAEDMAKVLKLNASVSVAYGDFDEVLVTKEWSPLEPGAIEHKLYAPGVGLVAVEELSGGKTVHVELVDILEP